MPNAQVVVRGYQPSDEQAVLALAPRLKIGVAPWRDPDAVGQAVTGWIRASLDRHRDDDRHVLVASAGDQILGVVTVAERRHFTMMVLVAGLFYPALSDRSIQKAIDAMRESEPAPSG